MTETVRLLVDGAHPGEVNMARDLALLAEGLPTLRLYAWDPPCASLGRSQGPDVVDEEAARDLGVDVVRRPTGGGAIFHDASEVTYSVVVPMDFPGHPRDIPGSFVFASLGILRALRDLGLPAEFRTGQGGEDALCYLRRQGTSIVVRDRKISGGAQRRTRSHVLQHGTIVVDRDVDAMARLFHAVPAAVDSGVTGLRLEGVDASRDAIVTAVIQGYRDAWGVAFEELDAAELELPA